MIQSVFVKPSNAVVSKPPPDELSSHFTVYPKIHSKQRKINAKVENNVVSAGASAYSSQT